MISAPRLRRDLTTTLHQTTGATAAVVNDPRSGRFFRLRETEWFVAEQLDGETPLDVVRQRTEARFGVPLRPETLQAFVRTLDRIGLLDGPQSATRARSAGRRRVRGSLLYLRFPLFDPDRLFTWLAPRFRVLFTRRFVACSAAWMLLAVGITVANSAEIAHALAPFRHLWAIPTFVAVVLFVGTAHEFAHGLTCKHFGGEVHEVGFMLLYFTPAFYCNVSHAWLFPEKSRRLWVGFAGPYFELFLWAVATVAWRVTEADTWLNHAALPVLAVSGLRSLIDLNPFIKLDGYYLLSDHLEVPNLRRRSFAYVGDLAKRLFGMGRGIAARASRRERRVYLAYGLVATVSSLAFLGYGLVKAGGYFLATHQPVALLLLASFAGLKSGRRFRRLSGGAPNLSDPDGGVVTSTEDGSEPGAPGEPRRRAWKRPLAWTGLAAAAGSLLFLGRMELRIVGPFAVLPAENADVRTAVDGIVQEVRVDEGDRVAAGDVIARLSDRDLRAQVAQTDAQVREARAKLGKLVAGAAPESLAVVRAAVARAEDAVRFARSKLARSQVLFEREASSREELEAAQDAALTAEHDLAAANGALRLLSKGARREDVEASRAEVDRLEAAQRLLVAQLGLLDVVSPVTGVVATPSQELKHLTGQYVGKGALIAKVYDVSTVTAQIVLPEKDIGDVHVGQDVAVRSRAYPDLVLHGAVTTIATAAEQDSAKFLVTTRIDNRGRLLKPGMTGMAKVAGGERRIVQLIRRWVTHTFKVEFWSWW